MRAGAVSQLGSGQTREAGKWDAELYERYRAAEARARPFTRVQIEESCALLTELARVNDPLVIHLVNKHCLRKEGDRGRSIPGWKVEGSDRLPWPDAVTAGRIALVRCLSVAPYFDPRLGGLAGFLWRRVIDELQRAVQETGVVMRGRKRHVAHVEYLEDERDRAGELATCDVPDCAPRGVLLALELRRALAVFIEDHCVFAARGRAPACEMRARYLSIVRARGETPVRGSMTRALAHRGAVRTTLRVPWSTVPVEAFAGVSLQNAGAGH